MKLSDSFAGNERFEGDRVLRWRTIPANAKIVSAKATVTPIDAGVTTPFAEVLSFNGRGEFGATKTLATPGGALAFQTHWLEVDFHARRTLVSVAGNFSNAALQVDVGGGTYVEINQAGAFRTPSDAGAAAQFPINGSTVPLPGLTVSKLKITNGATPQSTFDPVVNSITVSSLPANVSLRLEQLSPFFNHPGELTLAETSSDFATVLQAALVNARVENGFYDLLLILHSDTIARLEVDLEIDFLAENNPLPDGLAEVVMPFDFSTLAQSTAPTLEVAVPPNSRVVPEQTTARVRGNFAESRIAFGPTGAAKPVAAVELSPASSQAQLIAFHDKDIPVTAIDLLLQSKTASAQLRVDIRNDLDGKPGDDSLLTTPVELGVSSQTGKGPRWESVPLTAERLLVARSPEPQSKPQRYWLVVQCIQGTVAWYVDATQPATETGTSAAAPSQPTDLATLESFNVQTTRDGGVSWRDAVAMPDTLVEPAASAGPFVAFFRLRTQPKIFKVPIELLAGTDTSEVRIKLDRFAPLGRVDFALDTELAQGINESLAKTPAGTATNAEHLLNGDFERWIAVGEPTPLPQTEIRIDAPINDVVFAPDGSKAYVLDILNSKTAGSILEIEVACNKKTDSATSFPFTSAPIAFAISLDANRAYVTNGMRLQIVDLTNRQPLGSHFQLKQDTEAVVNDLALSPDGKFLYFASFAGGAIRLRALDTTVIEGKANSGVVPPIVSPVSITAPAGQTNSPTRLVVSPDGKTLYLLINRGTGSAPVVLIVDAVSFQIIRSIDLPGHNATAIALTPDGKLAAVTNGDNNSVTVVRTDSQVASDPISVQNVPVDVAISPNGRIAYVLNQNSRSISVVDLQGQVRVDDIQVRNPPDGTTVSPIALAVSPQGDQVYVASVATMVPDRSYVSPIQLGLRAPIEWHVTSGEATPFCVDDPFHLVAIVGSQLAQTGLSQVISVTGSTLYEFSFWGVGRASETDVTPAVAEVFWLGEDCGALGPPISIPMQLLAAPPTAAAGTPRAELIFGSSSGGNTSLLQLHRARATSPATARQAEVRFTIPSEGLAAIDQASLIATSEVTLNGDFKQQEKGQLSGWKISPPNPPGFRVLATADGIQLLNASATSVELSQVVDAKSNEPFTLGVEGRATAAAATNPQIEVRWSKSDGTPTGSPTAVEIDTGSSSFVVASGTSPEDAVHAEIHLSVPAGSTLEVKRASLRFAPPTIVKVSFIAEAPGELTVTDVRVAFEEVEAKAAARDVALCVATPPGQDPGQDECPCDLCASEDASESDAEHSQPPTASPVVVVSNISPSSAPMLMPLSSTLPLTSVTGIGEARARQLADIGIDSVEKLAMATPETVAKIKFITPKMAARIIKEAKSLAP